MTKKKTVRAVYNALGGHYDAMMRDPQESSWNRILERPAMENLLRNTVRAKDVADLGCGSGIFTDLLRKWGAKNIVGVDFSKTLLAIAHKRYPNISFQYGTADHTRLRPSAFDIVTSSMLLHYLGDLDAHFQEVSRILKNDGMYAFSCHHPLFQAYDANPFQKNSILKDVSYLANRPYQWKMMKKLHLQGYCHTFEQLSESLHKHGFSIEKIREPLWKKRQRLALPDEHAFISRFPPFLIMQIRKKREKNIRLGS